MEINSNNFVDSSSNYSAAPSGFEPTAPVPATDATSGTTAADANNEAADFVNDPANEVIDLVEAVVGEAVVNDLLARNAIDELMQLEMIITDAIFGNPDSGFTLPDVAFASNGDLETTVAETLLPEDVNGAFISGESGEPGTILLSEDLKDDPELLDDVALEEWGEALGSHVADQGYDVAPGDVGNRVLKVIRGEKLEDVDFTPNASGDDVVEVKLNGEFVEAKAADLEIINAEDTQDTPIYEEWGYTEAEYTVAQNEASTFIQAVDRGTTYKGPDNADYWSRSEFATPPGTTDGEMKRLFAIYGQPEPGVRSADTTYSGEYMGLDDITHAILDGVLSVEDVSTGESAIDFSNVSAGAAVDSIMQYIENANYGGATRDIFTIEELNAGIEAVLGDPDGLNETDATNLLDAFSDWEHGNPGDRRFTRDALESIFETRAIAFGNNDSDYVDAFVPSADLIEELKDEANAIATVGVIGTGYSAYGVPPDAQITSSVHLLADQNMTGHDVYEVQYTREGDPDTSYTVMIDAKDPEGHVLMAVSVSKATDEVKAYDSEGTLIATWSASDIEASLIDVEVVTGDQQLATLNAWAEDNGHEVVEEIGTSTGSLIVYENNGDPTDLQVRYISVDANGYGKPGVSVDRFSDEGTAIMDAFITAREGDLLEDAFTEGTPDTQRRLFGGEMYAVASLTGQAVTAADVSRLSSAYVAAVRNITGGTEWGLSHKAEFEKQQAAIFGDPSLHEPGGNKPWVVIDVGDEQVPLLGPTDEPISTDQNNNPALNRLDVDTFSITDVAGDVHQDAINTCLLYTSPSPRDRQKSRMPSSA